MRKPLIPESDKEFWREGRKTPGYGFLDWLHGYVYTHWIYDYIALAVGEHRYSQHVETVVTGFNRLRRRFRPAKPRPKRDPGQPSPKKIAIADSYHAKVISPDEALDLISIDKSINLTNLEHIVPYQKAKDIILKNPDHIVVLDCPCRSARENPCLPLDVCLVVGEPFASMVLDSHPQKSRRITRNQAMEIMEAEHDRGHVHHAFFKDAALGRFYAICNCCSCCCGAMQAHRNGIPMLTASGFVSQVDEDMCIGCGICVDTCQFNAIEISDVAEVNAEACMGCWVCESQCPQDAIVMALDESKGIPLEICSLMALQEEGAK